MESLSLFPVVTGCSHGEMPVTGAVSGSCCFELLGFSGCWLAVRPGTGCFDSRSLSSSTSKMKTALVFCRMCCEAEQTRTGAAFVIWPLQISLSECLGASGAKMTQRYSVS